jgi:hypothetical protein
MRFEDERDAICIETTTFDLNIDLNCGINKNEKCAEILENLDERGLAVWFMDGANVKKKKSGSVDCVHFHTHYFDYETHMKIATAFQSKFDIRCIVEKCESGFQLTLDRENTYMKSCITNLIITMTIAMQSINGTRNLKIGEQFP